MKRRKRAVAILCLMSSVSGSSVLAQPVLTQPPAACCQRDASGNCIEATSAMVTTNVSSVSAQVVPEGSIAAPIQSAPQQPVINNQGTLSTLSVAPGSTFIHDFAQNPTLNVTGDISNAGNIYAYTSNPAVTTAIINATNISNLQGGLISTLPIGFQGLSSSANLSLQLNAINNIVNFGTISSNAGLTLSAGGSITNGSPVAAQGPTAVMQALGTINMTSAAAMVNSGLITSIAGNINVQTQTISNLVFDNTSGVMQALAGSVNVGSVLGSGKINTLISGGNISARELNVLSGDGIARILAEDIRGLVNITAGEAFVSTSTANLTLGNIILSGDPAFYNTTGDITIGGDLIFGGQNLALVAQGNIVTSGSVSISTASGSGNGGNITVIAGANFTAASTIPPPAPGQVLPPTVDPNDPNIVLTILGGTSAGGMIDLTGGGLSPIVNFDASSSNGNGGSINLIAFGGTAPGAGTVTSPVGVAVRTGGSLGFTNGDVNIIADVISGQAVSVGPLDTTGGLATTGQVFIGLGTASIGGGAVTIQGGGVTGGFFELGSSAADSSRTSSVGNLTVTTDRGTTIASRGSIEIGDIVTSGSSVAILSSRDITSASSGSSIVTNSASTNGGEINIIAGATISNAGGLPSAPNLVRSTVSVGGATTEGGHVDLTVGTGATAISSSSATGAAGNIQIVSYEGNNTLSGRVLIPVATTVSANGSVGSSGASVTLLGGNRTQPTTISAGAIEAQTTGGMPAINTKNQILVQSSQPSGTVVVAAGKVQSGSLNSPVLVLGNDVLLGALSVNGSGGSINVSSGQVLTIFGSTTSRVFIDGAVNASGGNGEIRIASFSPQEFLIGAGATMAGVNGTITADGGAVNTNGGLIDIRNSGTGGIRFLDLSAVSANPFGTTGDGGRLIAIAFNGALTLPTGPLSFLGGTTSGQGGSVTLRGRPVQVQGGNLVIDVSGATSATTGAGSVAITSNGPTSFFEIGGGSSQISITIRNGLAVTLLSDTDLNVEMTAIDTIGSANRRGINFDFRAGSNLLVTGSVDASGFGTGTAGSILLRSTSSSPFTIGPTASPNGVTGTLSANAGPSSGACCFGAFGFGGKIELGNSGTGGINIGTPGDLSVSASPLGGNGGTYIISAGSGPLLVGAGSLNVDAGNSGASLGTRAGDITLTGSLLTVSGGTLFLSASDAGGDAAGVVSINVGGNLRFENASGGIVLTSQGRNGQVLIQTAGLTEVIGTSLDLTGGSNGATLRIAASAIDFTGGSLVARFVTLEPVGAGGLIQLGGSLKLPGFTLTGQEIAKVNSTRLTIGNINTPGGMVLVGDIDVSASSYADLRLRNSGSYTGTGRTLTLGAVNLDLTIMQKINTGSIQGTGSKIVITQDSVENLVVDGSVKTSGLGSITIFGGHDGQILLNGDVGGGQITSIRTGFANDVVQNTGTVSGDLVEFIGIGQIGAAGQQVQIAAAKLSVIENGAVFLNQAGDLEIISANTGGEFDLTASGSIVVGGVQGAAVSIVAGIGKDMMLQGNVLAPTVVSLEIRGSGNLVQAGGTVSAPVAIISVEDGNAGTGAAPIGTSLDRIFLFGNGLGSIFIANSKTLLLDPASVGGDVRITNNGSINLSSIESRNGSVNLISTTGGIGIAPLSLVAGAGGVELRATDLVNGALLVGAGTQILSRFQTSPSKISLFVGNQITQATPGNTPSFTSVSQSNGGKVFFGPTDISASAPQNFLTASFGGIEFGTDSRPGSSIMLNGSVLITVEPVPVPPVPPLPTPSITASDNVPTVTTGDNARIESILPSPINLGSSINSTGGSRIALDLTPWAVLETPPDSPVDVRSWGIGSAPTLASAGGPSSAGDTASFNQVTLRVIDNSTKWIVETASTGSGHPLHYQPNIGEFRDSKSNHLKPIHDSVKGDGWEWADVNGKGTRFYSDPKNDELIGPVGDSEGLDALDGITRAAALTSLGFYRAQMDATQRAASLIKDVPTTPKQVWDFIRGKMADIAKEYGKNHGNLVGMNCTGSAYENTVGGSRSYGAGPVQRTFVFGSSDGGEQLIAASNAARPESSPPSVSRCALVLPDQSAKVVLTTCEVQCPLGTTAYCVQKQDAAVIHNLNSSSVRGIKVALIGGKVVHVAPGRTLIVSTNSNATLDSCVADSGFAYRNSRSHFVDNSYKVFMADFSIPSAIMRIPELREKLQSTERRDTNLMKELLKTSLIISEIENGAGNYKTYER